MMLCVDGSVFLGLLKIKDAKFDVDGDIITALSNSVNSFLKQAWGWSGSVYSFLSKDLIFLEYKGNLNHICFSGVCRMFWEDASTYEIIYVAYLLFLVLIIVEDENIQAIWI